MLPTLIDVNAFDKKIETHNFVCTVSNELAAECMSSILYLDLKHCNRMKETEVSSSEVAV